VGEWYVSNVNHYEAFGPNMRAGFAKHAIANYERFPRAQWGDQEGPAFTFMRYLFPNVIGSLVFLMVPLRSARSSRDRHLIEAAS